MRRQLLIRFVTHPSPKAKKQAYVLVQKNQVLVYQPQDSTLMVFM
jgi:hypothetical protein